MKKKIFFIIYTFFNFFSYYPTLKIITWKFRRVRSLYFYFVFYCGTAESHGVFKYNRYRIKIRIMNFYQFFWKHLIQ